MPTYKQPESTIDKQTTALINTKLEDLMERMMKWVSTVLTLAMSHDSFPKLSAIKQASEEIFQCRINVLQSVDGHICVTKEDFREKQIII